MKSLFTQSYLKFIEIGLGQGDVSVLFQFKMPGGLQSMGLKRVGHDWAAKQQLPDILTYAGDLKWGQRAKTPKEWSRVSQGTLEAEADLRGWIRICSELKSIVRFQNAFPRVEKCQIRSPLEFWNQIGISTFHWNSSWWWKCHSHNLNTL